MPVRFFHLDIPARYPLADDASGKQTEKDNRQSVRCREVRASPSALLI